MVSTRPLFSKSSSPCTNLLVTVLSTTIRIGIIVTFMFHSFFSSLARSRYFSLVLLSFSFIQWSAGNSKIQYTAVFLLFFVCFLILLGLVAWPRLGDPFVSKNPRVFCTFYFLGRILGCADVTWNAVEYLIIMKKIRIYEIYSN